MTPQQLKAAQDVLEPLFMIYRLQGYEVEWFDDDELGEGTIRIKDEDIYHTLYVFVDDKDYYNCEAGSVITWSKLKRLPNQVDHLVKQILGFV